MRIQPSVAFGCSIALAVAGCSSFQYSPVDGGADDSSVIDLMTTDIASPTLGSATLTGTIAGKTLAPTDAVFSNDTATSILLTITPGVCGYLGSGLLARSSQSILLFINSPTVKPGTTTLNGPSFAVEYAIDAKCNVSGPLSTAGTVTIATVSATAITGSYDVTFGADHVTGTFTAGNCPALATLPDSPGCI
jgi:hypothetical protein